MDKVTIVFLNNSPNLEYPSNWGIEYGQYAINKTWLWGFIYLFYHTRKGRENSKPCSTQGFQIRTVHWTVKDKGLRFLRSNCDDVIINLIIILNINKYIKLLQKEFFLNSTYKYKDAVNTNL